MFEAHFSRLQDFLDRIDESTFAFVSIPFDGREPELYSFPANIDWKTYESGREESPTGWAAAMDHHVFGSSGTWGMRWLTRWSMYFLAAQPGSTWAAMQKAFELKDRGKDQLKKHGVLELEDAEPPGYFERFRRNYLASELS